MALSPAPGDPGPSSDTIDLSQIWSRLKRGLPRTVGLALLGISLGAGAYFLVGTFRTVETRARVIFSFDGIARGQYPNKSTFHPDDLRAPEIVAEALARLNLPQLKDAQTTLRGAITIEGIIPAAIIRERDRLRANGQQVAPFIPDEYYLTLTLSRSFPLNLRERELLLQQLISVYHERFQRTYVSLPMEFGNAFEALKDADYHDYELVLAQEAENIENFLREMSLDAEGFRSPRSNLSFRDLEKQNQLFVQVRLNETLGLIRQFGLARDRAPALTKMQYHLRTLEDRELAALSEEKTVQALLAGAQERSQGYVLGFKSQLQQMRPDGPMIDQGLMDTLITNDAYNFLVRQALITGLKARRIQAEKSAVERRLQAMTAISEISETDRTAAQEKFADSLAALRTTYDLLITNIRTTHEDYQRQFYGGAVRVSMQPTTPSFYSELARGMILGALIGTLLGVGLSLVEATRAPRPSTA